MTISAVNITTEMDEAAVAPLVGCGCAAGS